MTGAGARRVVRVGLALALASCAVSPSQLEPRRPGQNFLMQLLFADGRLWLLSDAGELSSLVDGGATPSAVPLPEPALNLCARDGHLEALTCAEGGCATWTLRRWAATGWSMVATVPTDGDLLVAIDCARDTTTLLTSRRLVTVTGGKAAATALPRDLPGRATMTMCAMPDHVFIGLDKGEWGGGLRRIERRTGKVTVVERNDSGALCGGPLNTGCDPVYAIAPAPWKPGCVAAAIGLQHLSSSHGRIAEICGDQVREIYVEPYEPTAPGRKTRSHDDTVAFYGLTKVGDELWASGADGVYRIRGPDDGGRVELPAFKSIGDMALSFDVPGAVLVFAGVSKNLPAIPHVPLIVSR